MGEGHKVSENWGQTSCNNFFYIFELDTKFLKKCQETFFEITGVFNQIDVREHE